MRILVTGGSGFIGSHLIETLLELGNSVVCLDDFTTPPTISFHNSHPKFEFLKADVREPFSIKCDQTYHLACPASPVHYQRDPVKTIETAFIGTLNVLRNAKQNQARVVITSTSEIYGDPLVSPQSEDYWGNTNPIGPRSPYDEGKRAGESLSYCFSHQYNVDVRIARLFNCFGPRMTIGDGRIIPNFVTQALQNEDLTVYGTGQHTRSFCFVTDTVSALIRLMEAEIPKFPVVNVGNPDERTILSVAHDVIHMTGSNSKIINRPLPEDDPKQRLPDISKIRKLLGWTPKVSFNSGLQETINWFRNSFERIK